MYVWLSTVHVYLCPDSQLEHKTEQISTDCNISESDPLVKVANISSALIGKPLQYCFLIQSTQAGLSLMYNFKYKLKS